MPAVALAETDLELADTAGRFWDDPLGFVLWAFDWDNDSSLQLVKLPAPWCHVYDNEFGPDVWACELLDAIGQAVQQRGFDGVRSVAPVRAAVVSGHGIGKSAMTAWLTLWVMSTRPFAHGTVTANTAPQLESKTWAEIAKWTRRSITGHWFDVATGKGAMRMRHVQHPESWYCFAQTCREENSEAFAGQHAADSTSFYIFDESSAVPNAIKEVAEGGLTDGEPMMFAFGNGTRNSGWFKDIFDLHKTRWITREVDSRAVQITNKTFLQELVDTYGEDSDMVKVRVRGMFPSMSVAQFISTEDVDAAAKRHLKPEQYSFAPVILTCDPAWEGDDELVIAKRQGLRYEVLRKIAKNDNDLQIASLLAQLEDEHKADSVIIDGGYGTGIVSGGRTMGRTWHLVWFGGKAPATGYANMRAWMYQQIKEWLKNGGVLDPTDRVLYRELVSLETVPRADGVIQLESKKDMKSRGLASPNRADALALSFALPGVKRKAPARVAGGGSYDPYGARKGRRAVYDPYAEKVS